LDFEHCFVVVVATGSSVFHCLFKENANTMKEEKKQRKKAFKSVFFFVLLMFNIKV
jgi:hypothetical protein